MTNKTQQPGDDKVSLVRRLDRNTVCGSSEELMTLALGDKEKTHFIYRVGGSAIGVIRGESKFGGWIKLVGQFKAINSKGVTFKSGTAFLPGDAAQMVAERLEKKSEEIESVSFLYDVYVRYDSSLPAKYGYIIEPVRKPTEGDPLDLLFNEAKAIPMLEAQK